MWTKVRRLFCYIGLHSWLYGYSREAFSKHTGKDGWKYITVDRVPTKVCRYCNISKDLWRVES